MTVDKGITFFCKENFHEIYSKATFKVVIFKVLAPTDPENYHYGHKANTIPQSITHPSTTFEAKIDAENNTNTVRTL